jgi:hypothetical protein
VKYVNNEEAADLVIVHALAVNNKRTDVYHNHGFYPTAFEKWDAGFDSCNATLINYVMTARQIIACGSISAELMRRDLHIDPVVIHNGVDFREIKTGGKRDGYILWPKLSCNPTCDPAPLKWMADHTPHPLASMAKVADNVAYLGNLPRKKFLELLRTCSIYFGSTRENSPLAEMEAMATGMPVVGWNWGFHRECLQSGNGCELVEPGDLPGLASAIDKILAHWKSYHKDALEFARVNFRWEDSIDRIYELYESLL